MREVLKLSWYEREREREREREKRFLSVVARTGRTMMKITVHYPRSFRMQKLARCSVGI